MHNPLASFSRVGCYYRSGYARRDQNIAIIVYKYYNLIMIIYQREPVFTIGQAPFVAGAIHVRTKYESSNDARRLGGGRLLSNAFPYFESLFRGKRRRDAKTESG